MPILTLLSSRLLSSSDAALTYDPAFFYYVVDSVPQFLLQSITVAKQLLRLVYDQIYGIYMRVCYL